MQRIKSVYLAKSDIQPNTFKVNVGQPVEYTVDVKEDGVGCMWQILIPGLSDEPIDLEAGKPIVMKFTPSKKGKYNITCGMGMIRGIIDVK